MIEWSHQGAGLDAKAGRSFKQSDLFGGQGDVHVRDLLEGKHAGPFAAALACELGPKGMVGPHRQGEHAEIVICLDGQGTATIDQTTHDLRPGTTLYLPLGAILSLKNTSDDKALSYLIIKATPTPKATPTL
jgi:quercetin dioxygenase-like cupin family protein